MAMTPNVREILLPIFSGFYESIWMSGDTPYYAIKEYAEENGISEDELEFDYDSYQKDLMVGIVSEEECDITEVFPSIAFVGTPELVSPKYYNYSTDKIYVNIEYTDAVRRELLNFLKKNRDVLSPIIEREWSSNSSAGFISYMPTEIDEWIDAIASDEHDQLENIISETIGYGIRMFSGGNRKVESKRQYENFLMMKVRSDFDKTDIDYVYEI